MHLANEAQATGFIAHLNLYTVLFDSSRFIDMTCGREVKVPWIHIKTDDLAPLNKNIPLPTNLIL